jgi:hypothetical protein
MTLFMTRLSGKMAEFFYEIDVCINGALFERNIIIELKYD